MLLSSPMTTSDVMPPIVIPAIYSKNESSASCLFPSIFFMTNRTITLSDFQAISFKADNNKYSKSYTFKMKENTVRKIRLEFEIPHNHSEVSLLIIPEAEFQLETKNLRGEFGILESCFKTSHEEKA